MEKDKEIYIYQVSVSKKSVIVHQSVYVSKGQIPLFMRVCGIFSRIILTKTIARIMLMTYNKIVCRHYKLNRGELYHATA